MRVGEVCFHPADLRRAQCRLPSADASAIDSEREKDVRVLERVMIEKILGEGVEVASVDGPAFERDPDADLPLLVAFAAQRKEAYTLVRGKSEQRSAQGFERGRLVVASVEAAK